MKFTILGAGTWGTAVGQVLCDNNNDVVLYHFDQNIVDDINKNHKNSFYFDDLILNENLKATSSLEEAIKFGNNIIFAVFCCSHRKTENITPNSNCATFDIHITKLLQL